METNVNEKGTPLTASYAGLTRVSMLSHERLRTSRSNTMKRQTRPQAAFSKVSVKGQTVIPREVCERLRLKPGDTLCYRMTEGGVLLDKAPANATDNPFATFCEWSNEADEQAFGGL
jgi:antitoxin PrlF